MKHDNTALQSLIDREAIRDCLMRYAHAVDRGDEEMLRGVYWPNATDDHGIVSGTADDFIAWVLQFRRDASRSFHSIANVMIRLDGARANVESYFIALHTSRADDGSSFDLSLAGRYLDRMEKRGEEWRIISRKLVFDWYRHYPDSRDWAQGPVGPGGHYGAIGRADRAHELFCGG